MPTENLYISFVIPSYVFLDNSMSLISVFYNIYMLNQISSTLSLNYLVTVIYFISSYGSTLSIILIELHDCKILWLCVIRVTLEHTCIVITCMVLIDHCIIVNYLAKQMLISGISTYLLAVITRHCLNWILLGYI